MVTDDERREVAARLRDVQGDVIPGTKTEVHPIAGRIIGVACGYDLPDFQGLLGRLADLIEPCCDRDALLALADEYENGSKVAQTYKWSDPTYALMAAMLADEYGGIARRIREALGVES